MAALKGKAVMKIGMLYGNLATGIRFYSRSLLNDKPVAELLPVQSVSSQYVCIEVLRHKHEWMSFNGHDSIIM